MNFLQILFIIIFFQKASHFVSNTITQIALSIHKIIKSYIKLWKLWKKKRKRKK